MADDENGDTLERLMRKEYALLPLEGFGVADVSERLKELTSADYRGKYNITFLRIETHIKDLPTPTIDVNPHAVIPHAAISGVTRTVAEEIVARNDVVRVYNSKGSMGTQLGFEFITNFAFSFDEDSDKKGKLYINYQLFDDGLKYKVSFGVTREFTLEEDQ